MTATPAFQALSWIDRLHAWTGEGLPCALATVIHTDGSAPRKPGARMVVNVNGELAGSVGGGLIEHHCREAAQTVMRMGEPSLLHFVLDGTEWTETSVEAVSSHAAGHVAILIDPILPPKEVVAFGGGHIAERLFQLCQGVGVSFGVYDPRPEVASHTRFPGAGQVICAAYDDLAAHIRLTSASHCVVATHGHAEDELVLTQLAALPFLPYVGMVGSQRKVQGIRERLAAKGLTLGSHVYAPAGLALGGSLPGDIALSILAELKLVMEGGRLGHMRG